MSNRLKKVFPGNARPTARFVSMLAIAVASGCHSHQEHAETTSQNESISSEPYLGKDKPPVEYRVETSTVKSQPKPVASKTSKPLTISVKPTSAPAAQEKWTNEPIAAPLPVALPVKQGHLPLVYLVERGATIRIVDMTSNQELLTAPVQDHAIVAVHERAGIRVSGVTLRRGPLPADDEYGIFIQSVPQNIYRTGSIRPGVSNPGLSQPQASESPPDK